MMNSDALFAFAMAMFAIMNPIGGIAIFMGLVSNYGVAKRRSIALRCAMAIAVILVVTIWAGEWLLTLFGVALPSLQVAGGIIIAIIAISMLNSSQSAIHSSKSPDEETVESETADVGDVAVVPLAMPMIAGPGAIVTIIVYTHKYPGLASNLYMSGVAIGIAACIAICFLSAQPVSRLLGQKGLDILTKFMGLILLAIGVGMFADGGKGLFPLLAG